jgi:uncharacterized protein (DUF2062 family)
LPLLSNHDLHTIISIEWLTVEQQAILGTVVLMPRKFIKRFMPDPDWVKKQPSLKLLGDWIHDPNLWHLTRHSVANAAFIGIFVSFIPLPSQMIIAAVLAILFRANLAISVALVWITNPVTMPPVFYMAYKVGSVLLNTPPDNFSFELSWEWLTQGLANNWQPFLLGCFVCGLFFGMLASTIVRQAWRRHTLKRWHARRLQRKNRK